MRIYKEIYTNTMYGEIVKKVEEVGVERKVYLTVV